MKQGNSLLAGFIGGTLVGSGAMFVLDPIQGNRRRALARDKIYHYGRVGYRSSQITARDVAHRVRGKVALATTAAKTMAFGDQVDDAVLCARVRSKIGRAVSHPHAIHVDCESGTIHLSGPVLENEVDNLISEVESVRGVKKVDNHLDVRSDSDRVPSLQGTSKRSQRNTFTPTGKLLMGLLGGTVLGALGYLGYQMNNGATVEETLTQGFRRVA